VRVRTADARCFIGNFPWSVSLPNHYVRGRGSRFAVISDTTGMRIVSTAPERSRRIACHDPPAEPRQIGGPSPVPARRRSWGVGQAVTKNPVAVIIPCHTVLAAGGKIGGFSAPAAKSQRRRLRHHREGLKVCGLSPVEGGVSCELVSEKAKIPC